jgi:predicted naringenin-chalcone synthase
MDFQNMHGMKSAITAIGIANPKYKSLQQDTADLIIAGLNLKPSEKRLLKSIYKATGIEYRHSVLNDYCSLPGEFKFFPNDVNADFPSTAARMKIYKDNACTLALQAIENCLLQINNFNPDCITHLITVSCTGMYAPGVDIEIIKELNLKSTTKRTAINFMGCYGAFNGIKVADSICKADNDATVLIVCIEICTIHFQKSMNLDNIIANSIFADGAAACLIQSQRNQTTCLMLESFYCDLLPQANEAMAWHISDNGFDIVLSSYVPEIIQSGIANFTQNLLRQQDLSVSNIQYYAIHPGGIKILEACEKALGITKDQNKYSYQVLRHFGNMSSATILFVLKNIFDEITHQDHNKHIFSCAFGPGLTLESMLLQTHYA